MPEFAGVVCGVDATEESLAAARQAGRLVAESGKLTLLAAVDPWDIILVHRGTELEATATRLKRDAAVALERCMAESAFSVTETKVVESPPATALLREITRRHSALVAVGTHERSRARGIVFGSVASTMLHRAPCSVLIAREAKDRASFPQAIVVGVDGSEHSRAALLAGSSLSERFGADLRVIAAGTGEEIATDEVKEMAPNAVFEKLPPVDALVNASRTSDLLVVGSAGLHGLRALGSVSERVAHRASCSVLVVRNANDGRPLAPTRARVRDIMSSPPIVAEESTTLEEIARTMIHRQIGCVPIVDDQGSLTGIITNSDFLAKEHALLSSRYGYTLSVPRLFNQWQMEGELEDVLDTARSTKAREVMSRPVLTAYDDEPVETVARRMATDDTTHLPVIHENDQHRVPIGVIARHDLLRLI